MEAMSAFFFFFFQIKIMFREPEVFMKQMYIRCNKVFSNELQKDDHVKVYLACVSTNSPVTSLTQRYCLPLWEN